MPAAEASQTVWAGVRATVPFNSDEDALEALVQLKDYNWDVFTNRHTHLDSTEGKGISIVWYHDETESSLQLSVSKESDLDIQLVLAGDSMDDTPEILNQILADVETATVESVFISKDFDVAYRGLDLPIEEDSTVDVSGVRLQHEGADYIVQRTDDGDTTVHGTWELELDVEDTVPEELVSERLTAITELIKDTL